MASKKSRFFRFKKTLKTSKAQKLGMFLFFYQIENAVKRVKMFFLGETFVCSLICTLKSKPKNAKT